MKTIYIFLLPLVLFFLSCEEKAKIQVTNNVHNVRLDNISFSNTKIGNYLLPGESVEMKVTNIDFPFPSSSQLEFYMVKGDKRVFLKTKEKFQVDKDETLKIVITDDTELINPIN
jgi:hypothetical protein